MKVELNNSLVTVLFGLLLTVSLGSVSLADTTSIKNFVKNSLDSKVNSKINAATAAVSDKISFLQKKTLRVLNIWILKLKIKNV